MGDDPEVSVSFGRAEDFAAEAMTTIPSPDLNVTDEDDDSPRRKRRAANSLHFVSDLTLESVRERRGGNYSCRPSNARSASVRLHLIDGELRRFFSAFFTIYSSSQGKREPP